MSRTKVTKPISRLKLLPAEGPGPASNQQPGELPLGQLIISKLDVSSAWFCVAARAQMRLWQKLQRADKWKSYMAVISFTVSRAQGFPFPHFHLRRCKWSFSSREVPWLWSWFWECDGWGILALVLGDPVIRAWRGAGGAGAKEAGAG